MKKIKITTIFALLLFAALQGALAQTEQDMLQKELNEIAAKLKELRSRAAELKLRESELQRAEYLINGQSLSNAPKLSNQDIRIINSIPITFPTSIGAGAWTSESNMQKTAAQLQILKLELQSQQAE